MKGYTRFSNLELRLLEFAVACVNISEKIANDFAGRHFKGQLIRSGSSPALNYAEGRFAESKKDFIHKSKIVLKELHETNVCLHIIARTKSYRGKMSLAPVIKECNELIAIFVTSVKTAQRNIASRGS